MLVICCNLLWFCRYNTILCFHSRKRNQKWWFIHEPCICDPNYLFCCHLHLICTKNGLLFINAGSRWHSWSFLRYTCTGYMFIAYSDRLPCFCWLRFHFVVCDALIGTYVGVSSREQSCSAFFVLPTSFKKDLFIQDPCPTPCMHSKGCQFSVYIWWCSLEATNCDCR